MGSVIYTPTCQPVEATMHVKETARDSATIEGLQAEVNLLNRRVAKLTAENAGLYWRSPLDPLRGKAWPGMGNYKLLSIVLIGVMVVLYWWFK